MAVALEPSTIVSVCAGGGLPFDTDPPLAGAGGGRGAALERSCIPSRRRHHALGWGGLIHVRSRASNRNEKPPFRGLEHECRLLQPAVIKAHTSSTGYAVEPGAVGQMHCCPYLVLGVPMLSNS